MITRFAYVNLKKYVAEHPGLFSEGWREIMRRMVREEKESPGIYLAEVAQKVIGNRAQAFLAEVEQNTAHQNLLARQEECHDTVIVSWQEAA